MYNLNLFFSLNVYLRVYYKTLIANQISLFPKLTHIENFFQNRFKKIPLYLITKSEISLNNTKNTVLYSI